MTHTPTPWIHLQNDEIIWSKLEDGCRGTQVARVPSVMPEHQANAARIVECVNALDGIELPKDGFLTKENAHIFIGRKIAIYSNITNQWRHDKLNAISYMDFIHDSPDFAKLSVITYNQIPIKY